MLQKSYVTSKARCLAILWLPLYYCR